MARRRALARVSPRPRHRAARRHEPPGRLRTAECQDRTRHSSGSCRHHRRPPRRGSIPGRGTRDGPAARCRVPRNRPRHCDLRGRCRHCRQRGRAGSSMGGDRCSTLRNGASRSGTVRHTSGDEEKAGAGRDARHRRRRAARRLDRLPGAPPRLRRRSDGRRALCLGDRRLCTPHGSLTRCGRRLRVALPPPRSRPRQLAHVRADARRLRRPSLRSRARSIE